MFCLSSQQGIVSKVYMLAVTHIIGDAVPGPLKTTPGLPAPQSVRQTPPFVVVRVEFVQSLPGSIGG